MGQVKTQVKTPWNCKQKNHFFSSYLYFVLEFGTLFCVLVWRILYHVTFSCKGPIFIVSKDFASVWFRPFTYWQVVVKVISGVSINLSHWSHLYYIVMVRFRQLLFQLRIKL